MFALLSLLAVEPGGPLRPPGCDAGAPARTRSKPDTTGFHRCALNLTGRQTRGQDSVTPPAPVPQPPSSPRSRPSPAHPALAPSSADHRVPPLDITELSNHFFTTT